MKSCYGYIMVMLWFCMAAATAATSARREAVLWMPCQPKENECAAVPTAPQVFFQPLSSGLAYHGFGEQCYIVRYSKTGVNWKSWLKTQHSKSGNHGMWSHHSMASVNGEKMKAVIDFIFLGSKITVDGDCSHKIKRCLLFGRKAITNLDSV